ncbi:MAG: hypothetical protein IVW51_01965 [Thermaceae bacterium]|nr:hypothetical protein [Thermaceae bacterium]
MLGSEFAKLQIEAQAKTAQLRLEADLFRQLPQSSLRHRIAEWLRGWAETLEPSKLPPAVRQTQSL